MVQIEAALKSCPYCAAQMPETAAFCPGCGRSMHSPTRAQRKVGPLPGSIVGAVAYLTFIPAIIFLFVDPYRRNRFIRFHSLQCLMLWAAAILLAVALKVVGLILLIIPMLGPLLVLLVDTVAVLAAVLIWLVLIVKAAQGETFKLPYIGDIAEHNSDEAAK